MDFDFAEVLLEVLERKASDLHITVGVPPMIRVRGRLTPLEEYRGMSANDTREVIYSILSNDQRQRLETDWQLDFAYSIPGHARFRVNAYFQRWLAGRRLPPDPGGDPVDRDARAADRHARVLQEAARPGARHRPDRLGQVHVARRDDRLDQRAREEHIMTVEDPIEFLHSHKKCIVNQRELGADAQTFALALAPRCARTPTSSSSARCATSRRSQTALTAAETGHLVFATLHTQNAPQTIDRIIDVFPAAAAGSGARAAVRRAAGHHDPAAAADRRRRRAASPRCEVLVPTPAVRNLIREGKTHQITSVMQTGGKRRHADDGRRARDARALGQDHQPARRAALVLARGAPAPHGHRREHGGVGA